MRMMIQLQNEETTGSWAASGNALLALLAERRVPS
jgi:hypothetical protein